MKSFKLDGLDRLRDECDNISLITGWQLIMRGADHPHEINDIQVEAYSSELRKLAGVVIREEDIDSGDWAKILEKLVTAIKRIDNEDRA